MRALVGRFAAWLWKSTQNEYFRPHTPCPNCIIMNHLLLEEHKAVVEAEGEMYRARRMLTAAERETAKMKARYDEVRGWLGQRALAYEAQAQTQRDGREQ